MAYAIDVQPRTRSGGRSGKQLRKTGKIPAVLYGKTCPSTNLVVDVHQLDRALKSDTGRNTLIELKSSQADVNGKTVMVKELSVDPLARRMLHADLVEIKEGQWVHVTVPVVLTGRPVGLIKDGILQQTRRELEISCLASNIPPSISIDVTPLDLGDSIHVKEIVLGEGQKAVYNVNFTIVTVVAPEREEVAKVEGEVGAVAGAATEAKSAESEKKEG